MGGFLFADSVLSLVVSATLDDEEVGVEGLDFSGDASGVTREVVAVDRAIAAAKGEETSPLSLLHNGLKSRAYT